MNAPEAKSVGVSNLAELRELRSRIAGRKRRLVFHSDGKHLYKKKMVLETEECLFRYLPGKPVDTLTYSLMHQFNVARLYRSEVAQEWPPGHVAEVYGDGPDGLEVYIDFCRKNGYEAFWAMRMNDTHDGPDTDHGRMRWNSTHWKQAHPEFLVGSREKPPPHGRWSALDFSFHEVREQVYRIVEEVCRRYDVDGVKFEFFRHPNFFRSTAWGEEATDEERGKMTGMMRRIREMTESVGVERGRPILVAARTPDSTAYASALGLDVEEWMGEDLIDIWVGGGYFVLRDWEESVEIAHRHGCQFWAGLDESRASGIGSGGHNSLEAWRGRDQTAWSSGVDGIFLFNFMYRPETPPFNALNDLWSLEGLAGKDKMYVPNPTYEYAQAEFWLKNGGRHFSRKSGFAPKSLAVLEGGASRTVELRIDDDLRGAVAEGHAPSVKLGLHLEGRERISDVELTFNNARVSESAFAEESGEGPDFYNHEGAALAMPCPGRWLLSDVPLELVETGLNRVGISAAASAPLTLNDLRVWVRYGDGSPPGK